ncbi:MAG: hypothetical protein JXN10_08365, partial [Clostridia bacterium]|nr:hypothetical protein [Clostridia bacterium]
MKKYTEGKALIIVIIIMAMLLILAPAVVMSSNTEISQTTRYDNRMQAYLYARSGIDAALGWLIQDGELNSDFKSSDYYNGSAFMKGSIDSMSIADSPLTGESDIDVSMSYTPNGVIITSTGLFNGYSREILLTLALTTIESPSFVIPDKALFLQNDEVGNNSVFELIGSPGIIGDFGANTETEDALHFGSKEYITGDIYLAASDDGVMDAIDPDGVLSGDIVYNAPKIYYPAPGFPATPSLEQYPETSGLVSSDGDLMNNTTGAELDLDGNYSFGDFEVKKLLNIDLNYGDKDIVVENFFVSGNINLINRGASGTLSIHVTNSIIFSGNVTINGGAEGGDPMSLTIYYSGTGTP